MLNKAQILGRVGNSPEVKVFDNGNKVVNLSVATNETWKDKDGNKQEKTEWHRVNIFGKLADIAEQYVKKGDLIYLEGKIQTRKYQAQDGTDRYSTEIVLNGFSDVMKMVGGNKSESSQAEPAPAESAPDIGSDIPF